MSETIWVVQLNESKFPFFFFLFKQVLTGYYFTSNQTKNPECPTMFTDFKFEKYIQEW